MSNSKKSSEKSSIQDLVEILQIWRGLSAEGKATALSRARELAALETIRETQS